MYIEKIINELFCFKAKEIVLKLKIQLLIKIKPL